MPDARVVHTPDLSAVSDLTLIDTESGLHTLFSLRKQAGFPTDDLVEAHGLIAAEMASRSLFYKTLDFPAPKPLPSKPLPGAAPVPVPGVPAGAPGSLPEEDAPDAQTPQAPPAPSAQKRPAKGAPPAQAPALQPPIPAGPVACSVDSDGFLLDKHGAYVVSKASGLPLQKRDYTVDERRQLAQTGHAMPDGSFPISDEADLHNAIRLVHMGADPQTAMNHIIQRGKSMGMEHVLPTNWTQPPKDETPKPGAHSMPGPAEPKAPTAAKKSLAAKIGEAVVEAMNKALGAQGSGVLTSDPIDLDPDLDYAVLKSREEDRFTLGPVYIPNSYDAHDEWATPEDMQKSVWDYVRETGADRTVYLQHSSRPAGEWVEIASWPQEVHTRMTKMVDGVNKAEEVVFPAGTPFMGVVWQDWAWQEVKKGKITGFSMGGFAQRLEAAIS